MPIAVIEREPGWRICLEGESTLAGAVELKKLLLEWLATGKDLELDLQRAGEVDIPTMQIIWAAEREAAGLGAILVPRLPAAVRSAALDSGFGFVSKFFAPEPAHA
jgi:hypothetical protein